MSKTTDHSPKSQPTSLYRTLDPVASWDTRLPAIEGPVLVISNAVGKGLWYHSLSLIRLLRQRGLRATHASFRKPLPERCEGWSEAPVKVLSNRRALLRAAKEHRTLISLEGGWKDYPEKLPGCRRIDIPNYDCIPKALLEPRYVEHLDELWATVDVVEKALRSAGIENVRRVRWNYANDPVFHPPLRRHKNPLPTFYFPRADGGLGERKGTDLVLEAFARARQSCPMRLIFSTTTSWSGRELPEGVELHAERVPRLQIADWYRQADWVLYPSRREGLGLTFFEAGRCGTPVITTDAPPMNEPGLSPKILIPVARMETHARTLAPIAHISPDHLAEVLTQVATEKYDADRRESRSARVTSAAQRPAARAAANATGDCDSLSERGVAGEKSEGQRYSTMVLITSYNRPKLLERAVESVLETTPEDCLVLVIDDASPAAALRRIRQRSHQVERLRLEVKETRRGLADSMNLGLTRAAEVLRPDGLLYYLQDDTVAQPGWLEALGHLWRSYRTTLGLGFVSGHLAPEHVRKSRNDDGVERPRLLGIERTAHGDVVLLASIRATNMVADLETWLSHGQIPSRAKIPTPSRHGTGRGLGSNVDWFLLRDGPRAMIRRDQRCGVLPGYILHQGDAAHDSTWNNPSSEFTAAELARYQRYEPAPREPAVDHEVPLELDHFQRIVHLSARRRTDGDPGVVAKFGYYLRGAIGCELVAGGEQTDLDDPRTLYIVDNHWGLRLGPNACCITVLHGCAAERDFDPRIGAEQKRMARRPRQYTIANSGETALLCRKYYGSDIDEILHFAVDESLYQPSEPPPSPPRVLMAANVPHKGSGVVEPLRRILKGRFEVALLERRVGAEPEAFRRAQIFVNPSTHEGFCYALLEALAADCAVVTTAHGLGYDLAGSDVVTLISEQDARDPRRLARRVAEAWRRHKPGIARRWVEENCSLERFGRRFRAAVSRADRYFNALAAPRGDGSDHRSFPDGGSHSRASVASTGTPRVSCIMPTHNRRPFVPQAIDYFLRQDYPNRELLIVDDGSDPVADLVPDDPRVRYLRLDQRLSLGAKRNFACHEAKGELLVHWDDDDWHAPWRLSYQVRELLKQGAALCGLNRLHFYHPAVERAWQYIYPAGARPWLAGGTLCYRRSFWQRHPFPDVTIGEDNRFVSTADAHQIAVLDNGDFYVARIHSRNTSRKRPTGSRWQPCPSDRIRDLLGADYDSFAPRDGGASRADAPAQTDGSSSPLVSCLMLTCDRRQFVPDALRSFLCQDYPNRELLILDDGSDPVDDLIPEDPRIRYLRLDGRLTLGAKRNLGCNAAQGEIIAYWDDDDWYAPHRLSYQVAPLLAEQADLTVLGGTLFYLFASHQFWACTPELHSRMFYQGMVGGTQVFRKQLWTDGHRYPPRSLAEEVAFIKGLRRQGKRIEKLANDGVFIYGRHDANSWRFTTGKYLDRGAWRQVERPDFLPAGDLEPRRPASTEAATQPPPDADLRRAIEEPTAGLPSPALSAGSRSETPLVSCVMATGDREAFLRQAVKYFQRQTYENKELIIVDDGQRSSFDPLEDDRIKVVRLRSRTHLGRKLNLGIDHAKGSIIQKLDDDDYYRPDFLTTTVSALLPNEPADAIVGLDCFLVLLAQSGELKFSGRGYCAGASLCFFRQLWENAPFRNIARSVDHQFLQDHKVRRVKITDPELMIVVRHGGDHLWKKMGNVGVDEYFGRRAAHAKSLAQCIPAKDLDFYRGLRRVGRHVEAHG